MICSMTAFARQTKQTDWGNIAWELRAVNHRYLDLTMHLPATLSQLEPLIRARLKSRLQRGKIDISLQCDLSTVGTAKLQLDTERLTQLLSFYKQLESLTGSRHGLDLMALLRWPGLLQPIVICLEEKQSELLELFDVALGQLLTARTEAGLAIYPLLAQRLQKLQLQLDQLKCQLPDLLVLQRNKLIARLEEAELNLDRIRLAQEMVLWAQKTDVSEEIDRLNLHVAEFSRLIRCEDQPVGRRLDFLLQELNREANTLAAKSAHIDVTLAAVELKVLIEELREQVQNVE